MHVRKQLTVSLTVIALFSATLTFPVFAGSASGSSNGPDASFFADYGNLLQRYVNDKGLVDYRGMLKEKGKLDAFASRMATMKRSDFDTWKEPDRIAFWINAYNALTLKTIIEHYPIQPTFPARFRFPANSIRHIPGVWDKLAFEVMGQNLTLDNIEHDILRKHFNEPRIHMAIVCASKGCAPLRNEPYTGERLDAQLKDQTIRFVANPKKISLDTQKGVVGLSPYFKWFGEDFIRTYGTSAQFTGLSEKERASLNFISTYLSLPQQKYLAKGNYTIKYLDYDWSLNEQ